MKHRVRAHQWENGRLRVTDHWFETVDEALIFVGGNTEAHSAKIFDPEGSVVHSSNPSLIAAAKNSYA